MITIKYASREQHKIALIKILSNLCINLNIHVMKNILFKLSDWTIQDLIQTIKNLIICTRSQTRTKVHSIL